MPRKAEPLPEALTAAQAFGWRAPSAYLANGVATMMQRQFRAKVAVREVGEARVARGEERAREEAEQKTDRPTGTTKQGVV